MQPYASDAKKRIEFLYNDWGSHWFVSMGVVQKAVMMRKKQRARPGEVGGEKLRDQHMGKQSSPMRQGGKN